MRTRIIVNLATFVILLIGTFITGGFVVWFEAWGR